MSAHTRTHTHTHTHTPRGSATAHLLAGGGAARARASTMSETPALTWLSEHEMAVALGADSGPFTRHRSWMV